MTYREKDIEHLEHMPQKDKVRNGEGKYYRRSWSKMMGGVPKVNIHKFVGMPVSFVITRYLHRLTPEYRSLKWLYRELNIKTDEDYRFWRLHAGGFFFIDPYYILRFKESRRRFNQRFNNRSKLSYEERMRIYYSRLRQENKRRRERRMQSRVVYLHEIETPAETQKRMRKDERFRQFMLRQKYHILINNQNHENLQN